MVHNDMVMDFVLDHEYDHVPVPVPGRRRANIYTPPPNIIRLVYLRIREPVVDINYLLINISYYSYNNRYCYNYNELLHTVSTTAWEIMDEFPLSVIK